MLSFASALSQAIPTQAHLALPPLQRTNTNVRAVATPLPGTDYDADSTAHTLVKTGDASAVQRKAPSIGEVQLHDRSATASTQIGEISQPPRVPKSNAPLFIIGAVVAVLAVAVGFAVTRPETPNPDVVVVKNDPVPVKEPIAEPRVDVSTEALKLLHEQEVRAREENARNSLGKGKTEFEVAKLDEAETYLKSVATDSEASTEARQLLQKIDTIREKLRVAGGLRARGQCDQALPLFKSVLDLNSRVKDALDGVAECRRSVVNPTME